MIPGLDASGRPGMRHPPVSSHAVGGHAMRYLKVALLLLAVTLGTQACIFVPVGGGGHHHHHGWR
jgi:hypothetical protein